MTITATKLRSMITETIKGTALHVSTTYPQEIEDARFEVMDAVERHGLRLSRSGPRRNDPVTASVSKSVGPKNYVITVDVYDPKSLPASRDAALLADLKKICPQTKRVMMYDGTRLNFVMSFPKSADERVAPTEFAVPKISGIEDVSTERQRANGTTVILDKETGDKYSLHSNGYVRKIRISNSPYKAGQEEGTVMMKPGGGTPDQMVDLVVSAIQRSRKKAFDESVKRVVIEAIKGQALYATYKPSQDALDVRSSIESVLDDFGFDVSERYVQHGSAHFAMSGNARSETISITMYVEDIKEVSSVRELATRIKEAAANTTKLKTSVMTRDILKSYDTSTIAIIVSIEKSEADKQQPIAFDVPQIPGVEDISTEKQFFNGTVVLRDKETEIQYTLTSSGYVRKRMPRATLASNLMMPGGGTPEEMVALVVKTIEKDRAKRMSAPSDKLRPTHPTFNEGRRVVREAVSGALHSLRMTGADARVSRSRAAR